MKLKTIDLKGKEYATVPERIRQFREDCPNGSINTTPHFQEDGMVMFEAHVLKDKSNPQSADAKGHAIGKMTGDKAFEKLETIAVGRALAILGYLASGTVASSDEMQDFYAHREEQQKVAKELLVDSLRTAKSLEQLKEIWQESDVSKSDPEIIAVKDEMKQKLGTNQEPKQETQAGKTHKTNAD